MSDPFQTTVDPPDRDGQPGGVGARDSFAPDRRMLAGGENDSEAAALLQSRLHAASIVLVAGFGLFFARALLLHRLESLTVLFHALILGLLVVSLLLLSSSWRPAIRELRLHEVGLFATVTLFFMAAQYVQMRLFVIFNSPIFFLAALKSSVLCSFLVMLTYAIFIPNTWRRAACVIIPVALAPIGLPWILGRLHPEMYVVSEQAARPEQVTENGLFLLLGAFTSIFGVHTINTLRLEARAARMLNQYHLSRRLGGGGMGEVFLAEHRMLKRPCAIKLIRSERAGDAHTLARFEREVRATAKLSHWNTILIFDYGRHDDGTFYYAMEYLPGLSLDRLVKRYGPMPAARVIYLLRQACDALHEAHEAGLVHRDIKPANLFAAERGGHHDVAKLLDFGLVKTLAAGNIQLSHEDTIAGSPLYIAPEQVIHVQTPDRRADIYSLGAVAFYLLTGQPPFAGESPMEVMIAHTRDPVPPPSRYQPDVPPDLEQVLLRCLAKNPDERYQTTPDLADALASCAAAACWSPRHAAEWWRAHPDAMERAEPGEPSAALAQSRSSAGAEPNRISRSSTTLQSAGDRRRL